MNLSGFHVKTKFKPLFINWGSRYFSSMRLIDLNSGEISNRLILMHQEELFILRFKNQFGFLPSDAAVLALKIYPVNPSIKTLKEEIGEYQHLKPQKPEKVIKFALISAAALFITGLGIFTYQTIKSNGFSFWEKKDEPYFSSEAVTRFGHSVLDSTRSCKILVRVFLSTTVLVAMIAIVKLFGLPKAQASEPVREVEETYSSLLKKAFKLLKQDAWAVIVNPTYQYYAKVAVAISGAVGTVCLVVYYSAAARTGALFLLRAPGRFVRTFPIRLGCLDAQTGGFSAESIGGRSLLRRQNSIVSIESSITSENLINEIRFKDFSRYNRWHSMDYFEMLRQNPPPPRSPYSSGTTDSAGFETYIQSSWRTNPPS